MRSSRWSSRALSGLSALALSLAAAPASALSPAAARASGLSPVPARLAVADGGLLIVQSDGSRAVRLAAPRDLSLGDPSWSHDGTQIVVQGVRAMGDPGESALYTVPPRGGIPARVPGSDGLAQPAWSPDGATIAAVRAGRHEIVALPSVGGAARTLTSGAIDGDPAWSPDGTRLAFTRVEITGTQAIARVMVANADGSGARV